MAAGPCALLRACGAAAIEWAVLGKVLPAAGLEGARAGGHEQSDGGGPSAIANDAAYARDGNGRDAAWDWDVGACGEEQFVVLAAMEGLLEGSAGAEGDGCRIYFGGHAGLLADVGEIDRKAVAQIDGCRGCAMCT